MLVLFFVGCAPFMTTPCPQAACCFNGYKDGWEAGVDCGEHCKMKCDDGAHCVLDEDCALGLRCEGPDVHSRQCRPIEPEVAPSNA